MKNKHFYSVITYWLPIFLGWWLIWFNRTVELQHSGYGWANAFRNAWLISTGDTLHYDYFRDPLYSVLLNGFAGLYGNYAEAAFILGWTIAILLWYLTCSVAFRLAGGFSVWFLLYGLTQAPLFLSMPIHANTYPLSALAVVSLVWASCRGMEKNSVSRWLLLVGLHALALGVDERSALVMPISGFVLLRMLKNKERRVLLGFVAAVVVLGFPMLLDRLCGLESNKIASLDAFSVLEFQRDVAQRWATVTQDTRLQELCGDLASSDYLTVSFFSTTCGRATLTHNLTERWPMVLRFPWQQIMIGALFSIVLLKGLRRLAIVYLTLALWGMSTLIVLPPRYLLQLCPVFMIVPVLGVGRIFKSLPVFLQLGFGVGLFAFGLNNPRTPLRNITDHGLQREAFNSVFSALDPGDGLVDCTSTGLGLSLFPEFSLLIRPERGSGIPSTVCLETVENNAHPSVVLMTNVEQPDSTPILFLEENSVFLYRFSVNPN